MSKRAATGGYDPSGIDLDAWTKLEEQLEATIPNYDRVNKLMTLVRTSDGVETFEIMQQKA